jgi:hypothetical protein
MRAMDKFFTPLHHLSAMCHTDMVAFVTTKTQPFPSQLQMVLNCTFFIAGTASKWSSTVKSAVYFGGAGCA